MVVGSCALAAHIQESFFYCFLYKSWEVKLVSLWSWRSSKSAWQAFLCQLRQIFLWTSGRKEKVNTYNPKNIKIYIISIKIIDIIIIYIILTEIQERKGQGSSILMNISIVDKLPSGQSFTTPTYYMIWWVLQAAVFPQIIMEWHILMWRIKILGICILCHQLLVYYLDWKVTLVRHNQLKMGVGSIQKLFFVQQ